MSSTLRIQFLGKFHLTYAVVSVTGINTPRRQSLCAYLVLHRDAPQPRRQIAFCLWPDLPEDRARANLRNLLSIAALTTGMNQALALYDGDLLPDCYDDWIMPERERLKQVYLDMLEHLIRRNEADQNYAAALSLAQGLLQRDPLREEVQRHVMRLHVLNGDRAAALRAYQNCVTVLQRELGVEPGPVTRQVYEQLLEYQPPLRSTLPLASAIELVGRTKEWASLQTAWRSAAVGRLHMVLITGEAGIGKTWLAEELLIWADRQGIAVSSTHCYATEGALTYAPIANWLRERPLTHLEPMWLSEVARLVPELGNRHAALGNGVYLYDSPLSALHTTIVRDSGRQGTGIYVNHDLPAYNTVMLTNTILVNQTVGVTVTATNTITFNGVLWFGNDANTGGAGSFNVQNAASGDPAFAADGYHLTHSSLAIDHGINAGVLIDIDGDLRPISSSIDLGADEFNFKMYLPCIIK